MITCTNCQHTFEGNFCNNCGQKKYKRFSVKGVLHDIPHSVFHVDKGILKNVVNILHPKRSVFEYINGKRKDYFSPFLFFLLTLALIFFIEHSLESSAMFAIDLEGWDNKTHDAGAVIGKYLKYLYFACCFIFALPSYLLFKKESSFNYAEHVVANIFILGYMNLIYMLFIFFPFAVAFPFNLITLSSFFLLTALVFYKGNIFITILKSLLALSMDIALFLLFNLILGYLFMIYDILVHG